MTAPTYVYIADEEIDNFFAGPGLPVLTQKAQLVSVQSTLDQLLAAAGRAGVELRTAATGGSSTPGQPPTYLLDVVQGTNVTIDKTDPRRPVISSPGGGTVTSSSITDATTVGRAVLTATDAPSARAAVGAVGTARTVNGHALTADVTVTKGEVGLGNVDNTADTAKPISTAQAAAFNLRPPAVSWDGTGGTPARPVTVAGAFVLWFSPTQPAGGGTVGGGAGAVDGLDFWFRTP
jgi:hypothetical protein